MRTKSNTNGALLYTNDDISLSVVFLQWVTPSAHIKWVYNTHTRALRARIFCPAQRQEKCQEWTERDAVFLLFGAHWVLLYFIISDMAAYLTLSNHDNLSNWKTGRIDYPHWRTRADWPVVNSFSCAFVNRNFMISTHKFISKFLLLLSGNTRIHLSIFTCQLIIDQY